MGCETGNYQTEVKVLLPPSGLTNVKVVGWPLGTSALRDEPPLRVTLVLDFHGTWPQGWASEPMVTWTPFCRLSAAEGQAERVARFRHGGDDRRRNRHGDLRRVLRHVSPVASVRVSLGV